MNPHDSMPRQQSSNDGVTRKVADSRYIESKLGENWKDDFVELNSQDWGVNALEYFYRLV